ncbi:MAG: 4-hydroxythreonine-4-phosphate dehydrogenase PdxA [Candidatus Latescibacteria bacterium]|nr:4-hydroxythreonine-4-phosphate dehydrogenase PdxA [Candidatus Latescibacterota bacterium]
MAAKLKLIAVTSGEPGGIGPEIVAKWLGRFRPTRSVAVVIGAPDLFARWKRRYHFAPPVVSSLDEAQAAAATARVILLDTGLRAEYPTGDNSEGGGLHAGTAIRLACELAKNRSVTAIVTPPASKKSLNLAHFDYPGHTEMLAHYLMAPDCQMMMVRGGLRVVPFTRHLPLARVAGELKPNALATCIRVTAQALKRDFKIARPKIAVAGLNPHAGEHGVMGTEDRDVIAPVVELLRAEGIDASGPYPADAMFQSAPEAAKGKGRFHAYIAMYHDQGLVPFKMLAQRRGVNVTVGLPVPRTSVDHGTAYDIAGKGIAEFESLREAYTLAEWFVTGRRTR